MSLVGRGAVRGSSTSVPDLHYTPAMMQFNTDSDYYSKATVAVSGNKFTVVARFSLGALSGADYRTVLMCRSTYDRFVMYQTGDAWVADARVNCLSVEIKNSTGTLLAKLPTPAGSYIADGAHIMMLSFDGDAGTASWIIDGASAIDTGNAWYSAPTTGTVEGGTPTFVVANNLGASRGIDGGQIGFYGYRDAYLTNWNDFMDNNGNPKEIDTSTWTEWGAQPLLWNHHGNMENNLGSAGNMTRNGTIVVGKGGN